MAPPSEWPVKVTCLMSSKSTCCEVRIDAFEIKTAEGCLALSRWLDGDG